MRLLKLIFICLGILAVFILAGQIVAAFVNNSNALLRVETSEKAKVSLAGKSLGETPVLSKNLKSGDLDLKLESTLNGGKVSFETTVSLSAQNLTAVNYDFGPSKTFSSGDIRTFKFGKGLSVVSSPKGAKVFLDGENMGKTPLSLTTTSGVHKIRLELPGYFSREMEVNIDPSLRLVLQVFLAQNPFERFEKMQEGKTNIYDLSSKTSSLTTNSQNWSLGIFHFQKSKNVTFDLLIDAEGKSFFAKKEDFEKKLKEGTNITIGYMGSSWPLSDAAAKTLADLNASAAPAPTPAPTPAPASPQVQIGNTPTGFLNVRSGPGSSYGIVTKVYPGEKHQLLEENNGWYKIPSGWISGQYAKKI